MEAQIKLFRVFGIQIGLHYSWLLIALLVVFSLAGQFAATNPQWGPNVIWAMAILTALLFFAAIVVHELSHAAIAKARGLPVRRLRRTRRNRVAVGSCKYSFGKRGP